MIEKRPKLIRDMAYPGRPEIPAGRIGVEVRADPLAGPTAWRWGTFNATESFIRDNSRWFDWVDFCTDCNREACDTSRYFCACGWAVARCHGHAPKITQPKATLKITSKDGSVYECVLEDVTIKLERKAGDSLSREAADILEGFER